MKKLIMLGTAQTAFDVPYDDPNVEIWGLGTCFSHPDIKRIDVGFELHTPKIIKDVQIAKGTNFKKFGNIPIYVQDANNEMIKNHIDQPITFPLNELLKYVKDNGLHKFFSCSWGYLIPYAIMLGYTDIEILKVSLSSDQEYVYEKPCIVYWCSTLGRMKNIKLSIPDDSFINYEPMLYGYEEQSNKYRATARNKFLWQRYHDTVSKFNHRLAELGRMIGSKDIINLSLNKDSKEQLTNLDRQLTEHLPLVQGEIQELKQKLALYEGCLQAEIFYNELLN